MSDETHISKTEPTGQNKLKEPKKQSLAAQKIATVMTILATRHSKDRSAKTPPTIMKPDPVKYGDMVIDHEPQILTPPSVSYGKENGQG